MTKSTPTLASRLGTVLIAASLLFFLILYGPFLLLFLPGKTVAVPQNQPGLTITIPKINAQAPIIKDVDPWNEAEYRTRLKEGVAHAKGSSLPGEGSTTYLFAHSSDLPWNLTRYNTAFFRLGELQPGDAIMVTDDVQTFTYQVTAIKVVRPDEVKYLTQFQDKDQLILQTCTPIGTALKRLLVFAAPA
ncbi:MAG: sortase [Candidatus Chisholmbacteria bacterium]|nr:sortase [Candidatus Chisholmbacteria bacterium]